MEELEDKYTHTKHTHNHINPCRRFGNPVVPRRTANSCHQHQLMDNHIKLDHRHNNVGRRHMGDNKPMLLLLLLNDIGL